MSFLLLVFLAAPLEAAQIPWRLEHPVQARITANFADGRISESSGVAASRRLPGLLWTENDSGNPPFVFATDTSGASRGTFDLRGAQNEDWEDIALGPCGKVTCLYVADTGDNRERRRFVTVYRVPEPSLPAKRPRRDVDVGPVQSVSFRYPDGPHDVEAMWIAPNEDVHLVSKGRSGPVEHYRVPAAAWSSRKLSTAQLVERLPLLVRSRSDRVTGAALSPDARIVAIRTYSTVYFFLPADDGRLRVPGEALACDVRGLGVQGEGVSWLDARRLALTSEQSLLPAGTIAVAECPLPSPVAKR
jgi:hypothetical protein